MVIRRGQSLPFFIYLIAARWLYSSRERREETRPAGPGVRIRDKAERASEREREGAIECSSVNPSKLDFRFHRHVETTAGSFSSPRFFSLFLHFIRISLSSSCPARRAPGDILTVWDQAVCSRGKFIIQIYLGYALLLLK